MRNWIERALGKRIVWNPVCVGRKGGREVYEIDFEDGTSGLYFIDFEEEEIGEVVYG